MLVVGRWLLLLVGCWLLVVNGCWWLDVAVIVADVIVCLLLMVGWLVCCWLVVG